MISLFFVQQQTHIIGRKHQTKMAQKVHDAAQFRANQKAKENKAPTNKIVMDIAPGKKLRYFPLKRGL